MAEEKEIGKVTHYFTNLGVAVVELTAGELKVGDKIHIKGASSDFEQTVDSLQVEHQPVEKVKKGEAAGMKVVEHVREGDLVYLVE
jgi:putative protease